MLFSHKHLLEELRKNGRRAPAEILSMKTVGSGSSMKAMWASDNDLSAGWMDCWMDLRVMPRGEAPFEAKVLTRIHTLKFQGSGVPVWYDPNDHSKVAVDYEADLTAHDENMGQLDRLVHRNDQRVGLAWTPLGGHLLPVEVMAKRGKGHLQPSGKLGKLFEGVANTAVGYVRAHAAELRLELTADWFAHHDIQLDVPYGSVPHGTAPEEAESTGLGVVAALTSLLGGHLVRVDVAVTGALSPDGTLLAVPDMAAKVHAIRESHTQNFIVPAASHDDVLHVPQDHKRGIEIIYAATPAEALHTALTKRPVNGYQPPA